MSKDPDCPARFERNAIVLATQHRAIRWDLIDRLSRLVYQPALNSLHEAPVQEVCR